MGLLTFKGGIHPNDGKSLAKDQPIKEVIPTGKMIYPLSQHIGAPATAIVAKGDAVLKGQKIAEAGGFVSAPIYSSVSGKVLALEKHLNPTGNSVDCIVIENDGEYNEVEYSCSKALGELSKEEILNKIGEAGIAKNTFPVDLTIEAPTAPLIAKVDPTDKSIPPVKITKVIPIAMIALTETCVNTLVILDTLKKFGVTIVITIHNESEC